MDKSFKTIILKDCVPPLGGHSGRDKKQICWKDALGDSVRVIEFLD